MPENFTDSTVFNLDQIDEVFNQKEGATGVMKKKFLKRLKKRVKKLRIIKNDFSINKKIAMQNLFSYER